MSAAREAADWPEPHGSSVAGCLRRGGMASRVRVPWTPWTPPLVGEKRSGPVLFQKENDPAISFESINIPISLNNDQAIVRSDPLGGPRGVL